jgi:butyryl-CoA dehydrogenase
VSRTDLDFLLHDWLDVGALARHERFAAHQRDVVDALLDLAEQVATERFAPHNRASDLHEPTFDGQRVTVLPEVGVALRAFAEAGFLAAPLPERVGGDGLPETVYSACMAFFHAANAATAGYVLLTVGNARLLLEYGTDEQIDQYVRPMAQGRYLGTMALSEPDAGSSLADITTRAQPQPDGTYRLFGQKMWISGGDHEMAENIVHLVLARLPGAPAGTKGISLFLVPKVLVDDGERNDVVLTGINHKMGYRGTVNTAPAFGTGAHTPGGRAGAVGYLVGQPNQGLAAMFHMMNEARIAVGLGAAAMGCTGYLKSLQYARTRPQGRPRGAAPTDPQVPIIEHPDVRRMLLAQKAYAEGALALVLYSSLLVDRIAVADDDAERARLQLLLDTLTPIAKSWPSQWGLEANNLAIQVLGGAGYTRDFDVEQHYRDNRLNAIHEGTHGIQALDLLGRKVLGTQGRGLGVLADEAAATVGRARSRGGEPGELGDALAAALERLVSATAAVGGLPSVDRMLANATPYLEAAGHVVVAWIWLEQVLALGDRTDAFAQGKRQAARFFFRWELPRIGPWLDVVAAGDDTALAMRPEWF